jgi:TRAP-type mannitol/chloroaromatic compound transport system permease small subunit
MDVLLTTAFTVAGHRVSWALVLALGVLLALCAVRPLGRLFVGAVDAMNAALGRVADWLVLAACLISAGNAASRYLFSASSNAWLEAQWYMFAAIVMLGASETLRRNEHVRVDVIFGLLGPRGRLWVDTLGLLLFLLPATAILAWMTWPFFMDSWMRNETSSNAGGLLRWPVKLLMPIGFALLTLQGVAELIRRIEGLRGLAQVDTHYAKPVQ